MSAFRANVSTHVHSKRMTITMEKRITFAIPPQIGHRMFLGGDMWPEAVVRDVIHHNYEKDDPGHMDCTIGVEIVEKDFISRTIKRQQQDLESRGWR